MRLEKLGKENVEAYITYLKLAIELEPELMTTDQVNESEIRARMDDDFYKRTTSVLAFDGDKVVGRIEYHFYGCIQDGYRMCYVDWVYVLPEYRKKGVAKELFSEMEADSGRQGIHQYYLIRAENEAASAFYRSFSNAEMSEAPILRKALRSF